MKDAKKDAKKEVAKDAKNAKVTKVAKTTKVPKVKVAKVPKEAKKNMKKDVKNATKKHFLGNRRQDHGHEAQAHRLPKWRPVLQEPDRHLFGRHHAEQSLHQVGRNIHEQDAFQITRPSRLTPSRLSRTSSARASQNRQTLQVSWPSARPSRWSIAL